MLSDGISGCPQRARATATFQELRDLIHHTWRDATTRADLLDLLPRVTPRFAHHVRIGVAIAASFAWVDAAFHR